MRRLRGRRTGVGRVTTAWRSGARAKPGGFDYFSIFAFAASQSALVISMKPLPLQEFWPLQELLALLQADWPLQEFTPSQWTCHRPPPPWS